jgi:iron complex outermembrane receptor protein
MLAIVCPLFLLAQYKLQGKVTEAESNQPLMGATLNLQLVGATQSNSSGDYQFSKIKSGNYILTVRFVGYKTQELSLVINNNQNININLKRSELLTDEVIVNATRAATNSATRKKQLRTRFTVFVRPNAKCGHFF